MESWKIAREVVYADVPADGDPPKLSQEYVDKAKPIVDEQIQKAGVRLAFTLNAALTANSETLFKPTSAPSPPLPQH